MVNNMYIYWYVRVHVQDLANLQEAFYQEFIIMDIGKEKGYYCSVCIIHVSIDG